jgi:hypothetical protein
MPRTNPFIAELSGLGFTGSVIQDVIIGETIIIADLQIEVRKVLTQKSDRWGPIHYVRLQRTEDHGFEGGLLEPARSDLLAATPPAREAPAHTDSAKGAGVAHLATALRIYKEIGQDVVSYC